MDLKNAMSARRQSSSTSLSKFARQNSPMMQNRSLDFCNSFWGLGDGGVDVLFARMRGAARTMEELKTFWKERASIEEDYAKRLAKLGKMVLGRDEIGDLRGSLDIIRAETERQASFHSNLAQQIRTELEAPSTAFHARQLQHKKTFQAAIEKEFKTKQTQESYVNKAREKYEQDCIRINSFTAQASLVQGKDLEKINLKLERTQQTVQTNEREFSNFAKALGDTVLKWEQDWKGFCDSCQDMEEQRMEFMKDNLWAYANAVSTVCVADDESCEKVRVSLEQMEPEREMETFVRDYGTGNQIPDPPTFVNYQVPEAIPSSSSRPSYRPAAFVRASTRESPIRHSMLLGGEEEPAVNAAGIGAGGGGPQPREQRGNSYAAEGADLNRRGTQRESMNSRNQPAPYTNGISGHGSQNQYHPGPTTVSPTTASSHGHPSATQRQSISSQTPQQQQLQRVLQDPYAGPIDPTTETYIKVGGNAYKVDPTKDPQPSSSNNRMGSSASPGSSKVGTEADPLMKQLEELKNAVSTTGSVRRNTVMKPKTGSTPDPKPTHSAHSSISRQGTVPVSSLSPPGSAIPGSTKRSPSPSRDFRNSADLVVGSHPSASRPPSPNPPTAAFMVPRNTQAPDDTPVQEVMADYHQSLPGERKSISRSNSRRNSVSPAAGPSAPPPQQQQGQNLARPPSQLGHAGVGAHGGSRSNSPQPTISRGPSPQPGQVVRRGSFIQAPAQTGPGINRAPSPNTVGIALDPSGRVMHDELAQRYQQPPQPQASPLQQQRNVPPQTQQPAYNPPGAPQQGQQQQQRRSSYMAPPPGQPYASVTPPPQAPGPLYHQTPSPQPGYNQPHMPPAQYQPPQPTYQQPPQQQQQHARYQQQPVQQQAPPPQMNSYGSVNSVNGVQRGGSAPYYGNQTPPQQQQVQQPMQGPTQQQQQMMGMQQPRAGMQQGMQQARPYQQQQQHQPPPQQHLQQQFSDPRRSPSPQPPAQTTEDGSAVLFYVRALYDYSATIEEEFDFQAGDIIAVTTTPEDGWWTGELLDEARRQKGRNVFPSNFVCLF